MGISRLTLTGFSSQEPAASGTALGGLPVSSDSGSSYLLTGVVQPEGLFTQQIIMQGGLGDAFLMWGPGSDRCF